MVSDTGAPYPSGGTYAPGMYSPDDDAMPAYAIALCILLPLMAIGAVVVAYFLLQAPAAEAALDSGNEPAQADGAVDADAEAK